MADTHDIERLIFRNLDEIEDAWRAGNDAGEGFSPEEDGAEPAAHVDGLAESTGWVLVRESDAGQLAIYLEPGSDRVIAVGDANGAWCVDVTSAVRS